MTDFKKKLEICLKMGNNKVEEYPFVSALLVTRNEEDYIERALLSLIHQTYPRECYEIIVIDGESTDKTRSIVERLSSQFSEESYSIRLLNNPQRILSVGWNIGIRNAKGEYVVRIDAHGEACEDFLEKSVETIISIPDAVCVGGKLITKSLEDDDAVSKVLSSPFGVGNSSFRVSNKAGYVDTVVYGLYKKDIFNRVCFFNEKYIRNQDIELHSRIRKAGGKFYFNPEIECTYYSRNTIKKMVKQAYGNGKWNMVLLKNQNSALSLRHLVPFVFVLYLIGSLALGFVSPFFWKLAISVIFLHLLIGIYASIKKTRRISEIVKMPFLFLILHLAYGVGYLAGVFINIK